MFKRCTGTYTENSQISSRPSNFLRLFVFAVLLAVIGCGSGVSGDDTSVTTNTEPSSPITDPTNPGTEPSTEGSPGSGTGKATLSWAAPTTNTDGTPLTDLAGFKVYYGTVSPVDKTNGQSIDVGNVTGSALSGLSAGTYFFRVTAYDIFGNESSYSEEVSKVISSGGAGVVRTKDNVSGSGPTVGQTLLGLAALAAILFATILILKKMYYTIKVMTTEVYTMRQNILVKMTLQQIVMGVLFALFLPVISIAAPVIFYTDIVSGPNTGGENNNGTYLSIFGKGFGTTKGPSDKVTINGVEVATYKQWGAESRVFSSLGIRMITVQPGPNVNSGPIVVTANGAASNNDHTFIVNTGGIYFTDWNNGNDANDGSFANPKKSAQNVFDDRANFGPGDTIILMGGNYQQKQDGRGYFMIFEDYPIGSESNPTTVMGYPGQDVFIDMRTANPSGGYALFGTYTVPSQDAGLVLSNFRGDSGGDSAMIMRATAYVRIVNAEIQGMEGLGNGTGMISTHGSFLKILGNKVHNSGENKFYHGVYWSNQGTDNEVAYNEIYDVRGGRGIQVYDAGSGPFFNFDIHDNVIHDVDRDAIGIGGPSSTGFKIYNNIIYRTGLGTAPYGGGSGGNGGSSGLRFKAGNLVAEIYNNTLYDNQSDAGAFYLASATSLTIKNNIIFADTCYRDNSAGQTACTNNNGQKFYEQFSLSDSVITASNNLWYSSASTPPQSPPSWDSSPVNSNPLFIDPTNPARNFHLQSGSPAIDTGLNTLITKDMDGILRPQGTAFDIGAYEFCTTNCTFVDTIPPLSPTGLTVK